jgi:hypothetical protein
VVVVSAWASAGSGTATATSNASSGRPTTGRQLDRRRLPHGSERYWKKYAVLRNRHPQSRRS